MFGLGDRPWKQYYFSKCFFVFLHSCHSKGDLTYIDKSQDGVADKSLWKPLTGTLWFHSSGLSLLCAAGLGSGALAPILDDLWFVSHSLKNLGCYFCSLSRSVDEPGLLRISEEPSYGW